MELGLQRAFGLVYVDYPSQRRLPKESFRWFADQVKAHSAAAAPTV